MLALKLAVELSLLIILGWFIGKIRLLSERFEEELSKFIIDVSLPCLIVAALNKPFDPAQISGLMTIVLLSFGLMAAFFVVGQIGYLAVGKGASGKLVRFGTTFCNYTYFGIPVMEALFGAEGLFLYSIFGVPIRIVIYFFASVNFSGETGVKSGKDVLRLVFTPPTVAVLVGLALYFGNIALPDFLFNAMDAVGDVSSPLGMMLVGMSLSHIQARDVLRFPKAYITVALRCFVCPILTMAVLYFTKLNPLYIKMSVIYAVLPVPAITTSYIIAYEKNKEAERESAVAILVSTLLSIVTLPAAVKLLEMIYG